MVAPSALTRTKGRSPSVRTLVLAALVALLAAVLVSPVGPGARRAWSAPPPPPVPGGDARVDPSRFRVTVFASELDYPHSIQRLSDGSMLVGTGAPVSGSGYFGSIPTLLRFVDQDGNGVADNPSGTPLYTSPRREFLTSVRVHARLVFITTNDQSVNRISLLRAGAAPQDPYALIGSIDLTFPGDWGHQSYALAVRDKPGAPGRFDVFFNVGSQFNADPTTGSVGISYAGLGGLSAGTVAGDSIYMVTVDDRGASPVLSGLTQVATGLRNAAGIAIQPGPGDLYFEDNGIDGLVDSSEAHSADELNRIAAADIGGAVENFGFPNDYIRYRTGARVGSGGIQPLVAFQPIPPTSTNESEGANEIAFAPSGFPAGLTNGVFVGFFGTGGAGAANEENPLVYADLATNGYFHFLSNDEPSIGALIGLHSTADSLFGVDISSVGDLGAGGENTGVVYQIKAVAPASAATLNASPATVAPGSEVTASWSGVSSPTATDWIGLYAPGAPDGSYLAWRYTTGTASGNVPLTVPPGTAPGTYQLRLFRSSGYTKLATSNNFTVGSAAATSLSASPSSVAAGAPVTASWSGISGPSATDWIGLYRPGMTDTSFLAWRYTTGTASGNAPLTVPPGTAPGTYELRLFRNSGYTRLATSNTFTVGAAGSTTTTTTTTALPGATSLSASPSSVAPGGPVTASWSGVTGPSATDWIGLYRQGTADGSYVAWRYTTGAASGNVPLTVPSGTSTGTHELRLFRNNGYTRLATSNTFTVGTAASTSLSVSPSTVSRGSAVDAAWSSLGSPTATDWIGLYAPGAADGSYLAWRYTTGAAAGNVPFTVPGGVAPGPYELRLFRNNGYVRAATSNTFTVSS